MGRKEKRYDCICVADFETTVWTKEMLKAAGVSRQPFTEVWEAGIAICNSDKSFIFNRIETFLGCALKLSMSTKMYFHNLKFDGSFILDHILKNGFEYTGGKLIPGTFKCLIGQQGKFYSITICTSYGYLEIVDSVKLLPFSIKQIGESFGTKHKKLEIEYAGERKAGDSIAVEDELYLTNDLLVPKEAIEIMYERGHTKLTIGACCMEEYKESFKQDRQLAAFDFKELFPNLKEVYFPDNDLTVDAFVRTTYKGAWCYCHKPGRHSNGRTYDINSEYPFVMHSCSGFRFPVGHPKFFKGKIPKDVRHNPRYVYFVHIKSRFKLKKGFLPTVQIKNSTLYRSNEWLHTSDFYFRGNYYYKLKDRKGIEHVARPDLYLTYLDYELFLKHYDVEDLEEVEGCYFESMTGIFDAYIDKYTELKINAKTPAERQLAKLFLNNLYGKFATSDDSSYLIPFINEEGILDFDLVTEHDKAVVYIPVGSMITSCARYYTINHAQMNYENFIYADTDSLHLLECEPVGIREHENKLGYWKLERRWSSGIFLRQKCYAEFERYHNEKKVYPHWEITCAGMPDRCKKLFLATRPITDFRPGMSIGGKLIPKRIPGGIILEETTFTFHDDKYLENKMHKLVDGLVKKW